MVMSKDYFAFYFLRSQFLGEIHYVGSSIWSEIRFSLDVLNPNYSWIIGQNSQACFLSDNWLGSSVKDLLHRMHNVPPLLDVFISTLISTYGN